jgi:hypothetical protein
MRRFGWIFTVLLATSPAWAAQNITVEQLKALLTTDQQAKKTDADVANDLKQVVLTEELTTPVMNDFAPLVPGSATLEQIYVLEAKSAVLPPPAPDIPTAPAPDAATQKALLDKAMDYASKTYAQLPAVTATKTTIRFQDSVSAMAVPGNHSGITADPRMAIDAQSIHYINTTPTPINIRNGIEDNPLVKDKTPWGSNGYIALLGQGPVLSTVLQEANAADKLAWLRWENVNGKTAAAFSFAVDKKKSHYAVNYCCFPEADQDGNIKGWSNYKATIPYHGEIFVDPATGIVVRLITESDFKTSDVIHKEDQRIDYLPVAVGAKTLVLPSKSIINTEVVPTGDSGGGKSGSRHTLFTSEYKSYQAGS